jgi:hypothetical protein
MKTLLSAAAVTLLLGCETTENHPVDSGVPVDAPSAFEAVIGASWTFLTNDSPAGCPAGFDTIRLVSQAGSDAPIYDLFDCADGSGTTFPLPAAVYTTWIEATNNAGTTVYAQSLAQVVDLSVATSRNAHFDIHNDAGYFMVQWLLSGNGSPATCSQVVGLDGISLLATIDGTSTAFEDLWDCVDDYGVTSPLPEETYTVSISAIDTGGSAIGSADTLTNRNIQAPNQVTNLGTVTINLF